MLVAETVKDADHRPETRHPVSRKAISRDSTRLLTWNSERITKPLVHAMADQPAADAGVERVASR